MMDTIKEILHRSFDGEINAEEKAMLDQELSSNPQLREAKEKIQALRTGLSSQDFDFTEGFADRVMDRLEHESPQRQIQQRSAFINSFKRIALAGAAAILVLLLTIYFTDGSLDMDTVYGISEYSAEEAALSYFEFEE